MTPNQALALFASSSAGRTRYEGQEPRVDEVLASEVRRLRDLIRRMADDLESHIRSYPLPTTEEIAAQRYERDMAIVREARDAIRDV